MPRYSMVFDALGLLGFVDTKVMFLKNLAALVEVVLDLSTLALELGYLFGFVTGLMVEIVLVQFFEILGGRERNNGVDVLFFGVVVGLEMFGGYGLGV